jgi:5-methylthioadenosine/S-adenosylhomocysteine deaminase
VVELMRAGVNVGLGTDGAASNNRLDLVSEMRMTALLAKGASGDAAALPAATVLKMATLDAARALNLDDRIGSIVPGKRADLVAVDLRGLVCQPVFDPVSHLVYVAGREHVTHVWVDGKLKLNDRRLVDLDSDDLTARATYWRSKLTQQG